MNTMISESKNRIISDLPRMAATAWEVREHAHLHGKTAVGAAVLSRQGNIFSGCNVEHRFRSHDVHFEVNALTTMIAAGDGPAVVVLIVAQRDNFTPCGSCLDWIFELGGPECVVVFQGSPDADPQIWLAHQLMPHYPS
jgi:cytidine deaminase